MSNLRTVGLFVGLLVPAIAAAFFVEGMDEKLNQNWKGIQRVEKTVGQIQEKITTIREGTDNDTEPDSDGANQLFTGGLAVVLGAEKGTTACGLAFDRNTVFAAHYDLPCGTELLVVATSTDSTLRVRVMERAGSPGAWQNIKLALSIAAASRLSITERGSIRYSVENTP